MINVDYMKDLSKISNNLHTQGSQGSNNSPKIGKKLKRLNEKNYGNEHIE